MFNTSSKQRKGRGPDVVVPAEDSHGLSNVLDRLEGHYGVQKLAGPSDPYEMIVFTNCGYPATDESCTKGYEPLKAAVGTKPAQILKTPSAELAELTKSAGMFPELRAERLKLIARIANEDFGGNLKWALEQLMKDEKLAPDKKLRRMKGALKEFPVIGEPSADKILLFSGMVPIAAVPSACTGVPQRIFFGYEDKNYGKGYRAAQEAMKAELPETFEARRRAYLLLKRHGHEICKRTKPKCEICPIQKSCTYFQER